MESMSISFGDPAAQQTFANEYAEFLVEYRHVMEATKAIMLNRVINESIQEEADAVAHLEDDDPLVLAVEDKYKANIASFILARLAIDEFSEMLVLASNNFGLGALKILRSMYEKVVTSAYIAENPEVSRAFVDSTWTHKWSLWKRLRKVSPSAGPGIDPAQIEDLENKAADAQSRLNESMCSKCKQIISVHAWTKVTLLTMAEKVGTSLADLYAVAYQVPTAIAHATGESINSKMEQAPDGTWTYRMDSFREREHALCAGHNLLLQLLGRQNEHFGYGLEELLVPRAEAYKRIWSTRPVSSPDSSQSGPVV
jgi:hypothetical protein